MSSATSKVFMKMFSFGYTRLTKVAVLMTLGVWVVTFEEGRLFAREGAPEHPSKTKIYDPDIWKELDTSLPDPPAKKNFSSYQTSLSGYDFMVDVSTVEMGEDRVLRLVLATISDKGFSNITYEGYHCSKNRYKVYGMTTGFGEPWSKFRQPKWRIISAKNAKNHRFELARFYLCPGIPDPYTQESIRTVLKRGKIKKLDRTF